MDNGACKQSKKVSNKRVCSTAWTIKCDLSQFASCRITKKVFEEFSVMHSPRNVLLRSNYTRMQWPLWSTTKLLFQRKTDCFHFQDYVKTAVYPVLIISYEMFVRGYEVVKKVPFDLVVCDEGHRLKNTAIKTNTEVELNSCQHIHSFSFCLFLTLLTAPFLSVKKKKRKVIGKIHHSKNEQGNTA